MIAFSGVMLGGLIVSDIPALAALRITAVIAVQVIVGLRLYASIFPDTGNVEAIAAGVAVGSAAMVIGEQLLLGIAGRHWGGLAIAGVALAVRTRTAAVSQESDGSLIPQLLCGIGIGLITISVDWSWALPSGTLVAAAGLLMHSERSRCIVGWSRPLLAGGLLTGAVVASSSRPRGWWLGSLPDYAWFEGFAKGLAAFGPFGTGGVDLTISYHWFSYAWVGLITRWARVEPWLVLTRAAPLLIATTIPLLIYVIAFRQRLVKRRSDWVLVAAVSCSGSLPLWHGQIFRLLRLESFSAIAGLMWILVVPLALHRSDSSRWLGRYAAAGAFIVVSFVTKSVFGVVAFVYLTAVVAMDVARGRVRGVPAFLVTSATAMGLVIAYRFVVYDPSISGAWSPRIGSFSFLWRLEAEYLMFTRIELGGLAVIWALGATGPLLAVIAARISFSPNRVWDCVPGLLALAFSFAALGIVDMLGAEMIYGVYAAWVLLMPEAVRSCRSLLRDDYNRARSVVPAAALVGLVVSIATFVVPTPPGSSRRDILLRDIPHLGIVGTIAAVLVVVACVTRSLRFRGAAAALSVGALMFASTLTLQASLRRYARMFPQRASTTLDLASDVALYPGLDEGVRWIRAYVPITDVVATTVGESTCLSRASSSSRCIDPLASGRPGYTLDVIAANLDNQMILRSSNFAAKTIGKPVADTLREERRRREAVLDFARTASFSATRTLRTYGVKWVLIERQTTKRKSWNPLGSVTFANQDVVIVRLELK